MNCALATLCAAFASMTISPYELVASTIHLATLPEVFLRINQIVDDPHHSATDIARVLSQDPGMTARLLKIVNSPFYGFPSKIDSVSRAITIIGTQDLRDLILATSVVKAFGGLSNDVASMESFWHHSIGCALIARGLATQRHETHTERFFVAGLLHDIGHLLIYQKIPELAREALLRATHQGEVLHVAEQAVMGFDHAAIGGELLRVWNLPKHLEEAVAFHHAPEKALQFPVDAALIHLANIIATAVRFGNSGNHHVAPLQSSAWDIIGLSANVIEPVVIEAETHFSETLRLLQPNVG